MNIDVQLEAKSLRMYIKFMLSNTCDCIGLRKVSSYVYLFTLKVL